MSQDAKLFSRGKVQELRAELQVSELSFHQSLFLFLLGGEERRADRIICHRMTRRTKDSKGRRTPSRRSSPT
jgi:hypothetical protein